MADCKTCNFENICEMPEFVRNNLKDCKVYEPKKKQTNAERIRAMSDEELAYFLYGIDHYCDDGQCIVTFGLESLNDSKSNILEWLQSEAEEPHD